MIKKILKLLMVLLPLTLVLYFCQEFILSNFFNHLEFKLTTISIYFFHFFTVIVSYVLLVIVNKYFFPQTGYAFLAFGIIKMGLSVYFLMPVIQSNLADKVPDVLSFFIPFFLYLFLETIFSVTLLNSSNLNDNQ
jgi:hypothetical protein